MKAWIERIFRPDAYVRKVTDLDWAQLYASGYRLLLCDLDNTLQAHGGRGPEPSALEEIRRIREAGFKLALVTNAKALRAGQLEQAFAELGVDLPVYGAAHKPSPRTLLRACQELGEDRERSLMLGDQLFTDIRAGKRAGMASLLVQPITAQEPWYIWLKRRGEAFLFALGGIKPGYMDVKGCGLSVINSDKKVDL